jgi:mannose-6-phosphate isomerase-like protein (cupin superfamily)
MTNDALHLTPHESVRIRERSPDELVVEGRWEPNGSAPPKHFHPGQDESFEILAGALRARIDGAERTFAAGETFDVPRGAVHQIWNPRDEPARALWRTAPAGRTAQWFEDLAALDNRNAMPGPLAFGVYLTEYRDVIRLAGPQPLVGGLLALLGAIGRVRGYRAGAMERPRAALG